MNSTTTIPPGARRALAAGALAAAVLAVALGPASERAHAAYTARLDAGTLVVSGDAASERLALRLQPGSPTILQIDVGADGTPEASFDRTTFTAIDVDGGRGHDEIAIDRSGGAFPGEAVTIAGGAGDDTLLGGAGAETLAGGRGDDVIAGGGGADLLLGGAGDDVVTGDRGADRALLGAGADTARWQPGDGSDVVEGQAGLDRLEVLGDASSESVVLAANGPRVRLTRDVGATALDLDDIESVAVRVLGGLDVVTVDDLAGTDLTAVDVDLSGPGGGGDGVPDTVVTNGTAGRDLVQVGVAGAHVAVGGLPALTRIAGSEGGNDTLRIQTLGGDDDVSFAPDVETRISLAIALGDGE